MTKSLNYWENIYTAICLHGEGEELFCVSAENTAFIWRQYDNGITVSPEKDKENNLKLHAISTQKRNAQSTLNIFYDYAKQGSWNSYGKLLQRGYFGEQYFGFLASDKPVTFIEKTPQEILDRIAGILNYNPIYDDGDFAKILQVVRNHNPDVNLKEFNVVKRPSRFKQFCSFFSSCSRPNVSSSENEREKLLGKKESVSPSV